MNFKNMTISQKISTIVACLAAFVWMIHNLSPNLFPIDPTCPAIAVFTVCEAVVCWNDKRKWAYLLIAGAVISIAFFFVDLMI